MNFRLIKAPIDNKYVFKNLMQFYYYDFSEYLKFDTGKDGLFAEYPSLDEYWENENERFPYLIETAGNYAGFVLVKINRSTVADYFSIAEFFVLKKYRLNGIGKAAAIEVFNRHRGKWEVHQKESNKPARVFWNKTIAEYTGGQFREHVENDRIIQRFENH